MKSTRVLIVDDERDLRMAYSRLLRGEGFEVDTADNGKLALEQMPEAQCDVIVCDVAMPELNGLEFLKAVREIDLEVPVILVTGAPELSGAMEAVAYGAFRYLAKPVSDTELIDTVRRAASIHRFAKLRRQALESTGLGLQLGDLASLESRFDKALDELWMAFQPIIRASDLGVHGYEALVRSREPTLPHPGALLDAAARLRREHELGRRIRERIADAAREAPESALLFVNLNVADLSDEELYSRHGALGPLTERVVLEFTERESIHRIAKLSTKVKKLRDLGFRIAVDDLGAGYAGLSSFPLLEPDVVKIDMSLVRDVHLSRKKRSVVRSIAQLCKNELNMAVVCEGVEIAEESDTLTGDGVELLQGYFFGKPVEGFATGPSAT